MVRVSKAKKGMRCLPSKAMFFMAFLSGGLLLGNYKYNTSLQETSPLIIDLQQVPAKKNSTHTISPPSNAKIRKTKAHKCKEKTDYGGERGDLFQSQGREDKIIIEEYFDQVCGGTYLEMGGYDGIGFSNSYVFHKAAHWNGVLVEASPSNYANMIKNRPDEIANVNAGVCSEDRDLHWVNKYHKGEVSGFLEFATESFQKMWWSTRNIKEATIVRCRTLRSILNETVGNDFHFDIFSLDVEGAEYEALSSLDFNLVSFGVVFVESDSHNPIKNEKVTKILNDNGYRSQYHDKTPVKENEPISQWFINVHFETIYEGIATLKQK